MLNIHKKQTGGQILIVQSICIFILFAFFLHSVRFAEALKHKQESNLKADLVAVSVARVQAEHLQLFSAINQMMVAEMTAVYIFMVTTIFTLGGTSKLLQMAINSINNLSDMEAKFVKFSPVLMYWQAQRIARANGFEGAFFYPLWPEMPVEERSLRMYRDALKNFVQSPLYQMLGGQDDFDEILSDMEKDEENKKSKEDNTKEKSKDIKNKKKANKNSGDLFKDFDFKLEDLVEPDKVKKYKRKILKMLNNMLAGPHYLDERYIKDKITVFCFDKDRNIRVSSTRVTHHTIPRDKTLKDHEDNNYLNFFETPNNENGFQVELVTVPDYLEQLPQLKKNLEKIIENLKRINNKFPLKAEHFNWIQH